MEYLISPANNHIYSKKFNLPNKDPSNTPRPKNYTPKLISIAHPSAIINSARRAPINTKLIPYLDYYNIHNLYPKEFKYNIGELFVKSKLVKTPKSIYRTLIKSKSCFNYFPLKRKGKYMNNSPIPRQNNLRKDKMLKIKRAVSSFIMHNKLNSSSGNEKYNINNKNKIKIGNHKISFGKEENNNNIENKINPGHELFINKDFFSKEGKTNKNSISKRFNLLEEIIEEDPNQYNHTDLKFYQKNSPSTTIGQTKIFGFFSPKENQQTPCVEDYDNRIKSIPILKKKEPRNRIQTAKRRFLIGLDKSIPGQMKNNIKGNESPHNSIGLKTAIIKYLSNAFNPSNYSMKKTDIYNNHHKIWKIGTEPKIKSSNSYKNISGSEANTKNSYRNLRIKSGFPKQKRGNLKIINFPQY